MSESFGQNFKRIRMKRAMSKTEVSKSSGLAIPMLTRYERGVAEPNLKNLVILAKTLTVSADQLLGLKPIDETELSEIGLDCGTRISSMEIYNQFIAQKFLIGFQFAEEISLGQEIVKKEYLKKIENSFV